MLINNYNGPGNVNYDRFVKKKLSSFFEDDSSDDDSSSDDSLSQDSYLSTSEEDKDIYICGVSHQCDEQGKFF